MKFEHEWLDAPGVADRVLAVTWARLRISAGSLDVTDLVHVASDTRRSSVYGSVFPLVEWLVEHWWALLHEPAPAMPLKSGRAVAPWGRRWVQRHNLLAARDGTALPDATFCRDGAEVIVLCSPDPSENEHRRVRFVANSEVRVPVDQFERAAAGFIEATLHRLDQTVGADEDARRVVSAWQAIQGADAAESELCRSLALLGVDPYDSDEAPEELVDRVEGLRSELPRDLADDLLEGTNAAGLPDALHWVTAQRHGLAEGNASPDLPKISIDWQGTAHETGYVAARRVREDLLGLADDERVANLEELLVHKLGWDPVPVRAADKNVSLDGLVGLERSSHKPVLVGSGARQSWGERFRMARAAYFTTRGAFGCSRLLTGAATPQQRAGRAFAAELLAPAGALDKMVSGRVTADQVNELSDEFGVSPLLIQHQLENHGLGSVEA